MSHHHLINPEPATNTDPVVFAERRFATHEFIRDYSQGPPVNDACVSVGEFAYVCTTADWVLMFKYKLTSKVPPLFLSDILILISSPRQPKIEGSLLENSRVSQVQITMHLVMRQGTGFGSGWTTFSYLPAGAP